MTTAERFLKFVDKSPGHGPNGECWVFTGSRLPRGYGRFYLNGSVTTAHRAAWIIFVGAIPEHLDVAHKCDYPPCVRWTDHLFPATKSENSRDMVAKGRYFRRHMVGAHPGEDHHFAKITQAIASEIKSSMLPGKELARKFAISEAQVSRIRNGRRWAGASE